MQLEDAKSLTYRFTAGAVAGYTDAVRTIQDNRKDYTDIETVESYEKLGTALFYNGDYHDCVAPLSVGLEIMREVKELYRTRSYYRQCIMVSYIFRCLFVHC
jgi:hypothetical protein